MRQAVAASDAPQAKRQRVLVCEDNTDAAETFAKLLQSQGHEVIVCSDGPGAIALVERWHPSVAIIDIGLPGVTGYGVAQHIRSLPFGSDVLLIAITGYGTPADIAMAGHAGFDWHFVKPAQPSSILELVENPSRSAPEPQWHCTIKEKVRSARARHATC